jgi:hypothetical protein
VPREFNTAVSSWDATKRKPPTEILQKGFQLAYFLFPNRSTAINIVVRALEKLKVRSRREAKKLYWRDKHTERPVRRLIRNDLDMLQWLIMFESEADERAQERTGSASIDAMVIRYLKHLVQVTTSLSSFYVNVGIGRLLHGYTTAEVQRVFEMLTNRYLGSDEYRRAKAALMDRIGQRFGAFLQTTRVEHGELRFEVFDEQEQWVPLVDTCLKAFTPWSTRERCSQFLPDHTLTADDVTDVDQNELELRCCHILLDPPCYTLLLQRLKLDPPPTRLALPRFFMSKKQENSGEQGPRTEHIPELSRDELDEIEHRLAATDRRRRGLSSRIATVVIDGVEHSQFDLREKSELRIEVEAGVSLIEIRGKHEAGDLVLATHFIPYSDSAFVSAKGSVLLRTGSVEFEVKPMPDLAGRSPRALLNITYDPKPWPSRLARLRETFGSSERPLASYVLTGIAMSLFAWGISAVFYGHKVRLLEQELQKSHRTQQAPSTMARAVVSYTLHRDDQRVRGLEEGIPEVQLHRYSEAIGLRFAVPRTAEETNYTAELKTFTGNETLMTQRFLPTAHNGVDLIAEIVFSSELLKADTYYTVHLRSSDATYRFTFKVIRDK